MVERTHSVIIKFERWILRPLHVATLALMLWFVFHRHWVSAVLFLIATFLVGAIGQGLPHRKKQTFKELSSGERIEGESGELSLGDSHALARALLKVNFLLFFLLVALAWSEHIPVFRAFVAISVTFVSFPILAMLVSMVGSRSATKS
jgi:hypothetical protein